MIVKAWVELGLELLKYWIILFNLGEVGVTFKTEEERDLAILNLVNIAGTHVMFENQEIVAYNALVNPALKEKGSKNDNMTWTDDFINGF